MKRTYTVPLRSGFTKTEKYRRAKRAVRVLQGFVEKHMKAETVKVGTSLNQALWSRGIRKPPGKVIVDCEKDENGVVYVDLQGVELPTDVKRREEAEKQKEEKAAKKKEAAKKEEKKEAAPEPVEKEAEQKEAPKKAAEPAPEKKAAASEVKAETKSA